MTQTLLVSAFPDSIVIPHRLTGEPDSDASYPDAAPAMVPNVRRAKQFAMLGIPSNDGQSAMVDTGHGLEDGAPEVPYSPLRFRSFLDGGYVRPTTPDQNLTSRPDRTVIATSKHLNHAESWHVAGSSRAPLSTKDSIAVLGLSRRSPSPDYRILHNSLASSNSLSLDVKCTPPRSSSLSSLHMPATSSSSPPSAVPSLIVDKDDCSAIVFAEPSVSNLDIPPRKRSLPALFPSPIPSRSPSPSIASDMSHSSSPNTALKRKGSALALLAHKSESKTPSYNPKHTLKVTLDTTSRPLAGGLPTPVLPDLSRQSKSKATPAGIASPVAVSSAKASTISRSFKFLRARRALSISSAECLTQGSRTDVASGSERADDPTTSTITLVADSDEQTEPDRVSQGDRLEDDGKSTAHEGPGKRRGVMSEHSVKMVFQRNVGDAWIEQDYDEVIPILREMKFVGK